MGAGGGAARCIPRHEKDGPTPRGRAGRKSVWETYRSVLKTLEGLAQGDRDLRRGTALVEVQPRHPVAWVGGDVGAGCLHVVPVGR